MADQAAIDQLIKSVVETLDTDALIDRLRAALDIPPAGIAEDGKTVRITDPVQAALINELLAQASEIKRVLNAAKGDYEAVVSLLAEVAGDAEELYVHNALVFTYKEVETRRVNQSFVKAKFPDIEGNEAYWETGVSRRREIK